MLALHLYKSSLGIRRVVWVVLGLLAFWRLGYNERCCGTIPLWDSNGYWDFGWLTDLFDGNGGSHEPLVVLIWSALEIASVVVAVVVILQVLKWIGVGFAQDAGAGEVATDPAVDRSA